MAGLFRSHLWKRQAVGKTRELAGIEVLRFLCAFAVLLWHYQLFFFHGPFVDAAADAMRAKQPLFWILAPLYMYGRWAVEIFWAISGYIFYHQYGLAITDRRVGAFEFALRRFARLYPLHFATLLIVAAEQALYFSGHRVFFIDQGNTPQLFAFQLAFASNWLWWQPFSFNSPIWSVSVEVLVYGVFFVVTRILGARLIVPLAMAVACWLLAHGFYGVVHGVKIPALSNWVNVCATYFFAGGVLQRLGRVPLAGMAGLSVALLAGGFIWTRAAATVDTAFPLALGLVAFVVWAGESFAHGVCQFLAPLGDLTYASYLTHTPIQLAIVLAIDAAGVSRAAFFGVAPWLAYFAAVLLISAAVFRWYERPAQAWLRSLNRRRRVADLQPALQIDTKTS